MLYQFLRNERDNILKLCEEKVAIITRQIELKPEIKIGISIFYDKLIDILYEDYLSKTKENMMVSNNFAAKQLGKESLKLGYNIFQVVHSYGAICQGITEYVEKKNSKTTTAREFNRIERRNEKNNEVLRLGCLAHELRNALSHATIAYRIIKSGSVGASGNTAEILENAHIRMRDIIDRSLAEVRLQSNPNLEFKIYNVIHLINEVDVTASFEANLKSISIVIQSEPNLKIYVDHHLLISALSNLVQNAIKFTKNNGIINIKAKSVNKHVIIDVEDQCGGLSSEKEQLFKPFNQQSTDKTGLGLGLTISRNAIELNNGTLTVTNVPNYGCIFSIKIPEAN